MQSMRPEGIEPPSQEPESYVISITLRTLIQLLYFTRKNGKYQASIFISQKKEKSSFFSPLMSCFFYRMISL